MAIANTARTIPLMPLVNSRYGITEKKKAELDQLTLEVLDAQHDVEQFQAIVTSLTEKSNKLQAALSAAESSRTQTLNNRNLLDQLVQSALDLQNNASIAFDEIIDANTRTAVLSASVKSVMDKLIYVAQLVNKMGALVARKKALNPLISDDLVSMIGDAGKAANNAVALTLVALKSAFAAQASNTESQAALALGYQQSMSFYQVLTGKGPDGKQAMDENNKPVDSLQSLLYDAYGTAKANYETTQKASLLTISQLNNAKASLSKAQVKLNSLQLSLAAANAAALAS